MVVVVVVVMVVVVLSGYSPVLLPSSARGACRSASFYPMNRCPYSRLCRHTPETDARERCDGGKREDVEEGGRHGVAHSKGEDALKIGENGMCVSDG